MNSLTQSQKHIRISWHNLENTLELINSLRNTLELVNTISEIHLVNTISEILECLHVKIEYCG